MTINPSDVRAVSSGPDASGLALPAEQVTRITAVLNDSHHHRPDPDPDLQPTAPAATATARQSAVRAPEPPDQEPAGQDSPAQESSTQPTAAALPRHQLFQAMRRAGCRPEEILQAQELLPPQIDRRRDQAMLATLGLSTRELMDRMGSSP